MAFYLSMRMATRFRSEMYLISTGSQHLHFPAPNRVSQPLSPYGNQWLYGADAEVSAFLSENRELTTAALILSMAVYALYVRMDTDAEAVRRRQKDLRKQNDLDR